MKRTLLWSARISRRLRNQAHRVVGRGAAGGLALALAGAAIVGAAGPASATVTAAVINNVLVISLGAANDVATMTVTGINTATVSGTGFSPISVTWPAEGGVNQTTVSVQSLTGPPLQTTITDPYDLVMSNGSQTFTFTDPVHAPVALVTQSITFTQNTTVTYGQPEFSPLSASSGGPVLYSVAGQCSIDTTNGLLQITGAGTCTLAGTQGGLGIYAPTQQTVSVPIGQAPLSVNAQDASTVFGQAPSPAYTLSGFVNGDNAVSAGVSGAASCTASPGSADPGTYPGAITCVPGTLQAANYDFVPGASGTLTITAAPQAITFASTPPSPAVAGGSYTVAATGGASGQPVVFSIDGSSSPGACTITGATVSFTGPGSCVIDANQAGNTDYQAAAQAQQTLTITGQAATSTALATSANPSLYGQPVTFTATVSSAAGTPTGSVTFSDGGTVLGTSTLSGGVATLTVSTLALGSHTITAAYTGTPGFAGSGSNRVTQVVEETPAGLCQLTVSDVENGPKYLALPAAQRLAINRILTGLCNQLGTITPQLTAHQLALLIAAYKTAVLGLSSTGWLTATQASTLTFLASHLTIT